MDLLTWLYYAAAGWYVSYVITSKDGPFEVFKRIRNWHGGQWHGRKRETLSVIDPHFGQVDIGHTYQPTGLLDCIVCLMPWVVLILRLIGVNIITDVLAIAAVALWLHGYTGWRHNIT